MELDCNELQLINNLGYLLFVSIYSIWIGCKEVTISGSNAFKVSRYYHTDWMPENELQFHIEGLNMDVVYEKLVRQIEINAEMKN